MTAILVVVEQRAAGELREADMAVKKRTATAATT